MSSHHSQKTINLHHAQVSAGRERKMQRRQDRQERYLAISKEKRMTYNSVLIISFIWFAYLQVATAVYLGYIL